MKRRDATFLKKSKVRRMNATEKLCINNKLSNATDYTKWIFKDLKREMQNWT